MSRMKSAMCEPTTSPASLVRCFYRDSSRGMPTAGIVSASASMKVALLVYSLQRLLGAARIRTLHQWHLTGLPVGLRPFPKEGFAPIFDRGIARPSYPLLSGFPVRPRPMQAGECAPVHPYCVHSTTAYTSAQVLFLGRPAWYCLFSSRSQSQQAVS